MVESEQGGVVSRGVPEEAPLVPTETSSLTAAKGVEELVRASEPQARGFLARSLAVERTVLPLQIVLFENQRRLKVATGERIAPDLRQWLTFATGLPVELVYVDPSWLEEAIHRAYLGDEERFAVSVGELMRYGESLSPPLAGLTAELPENSEVIRFINCLLDYAIAHEASDVHISPRRGGAFVQLRIAGELRDHSVPLTNLAAHRQISSRLKVMAGLDITSRSSPQEGRLTYRFAGRAIDIRISVMPTVHGENLVLRIFAQEGVPELAQLGLPAGVLEQLNRCMGRCSGGVIIAGPTGSGKTSTLYAIVGELRKQRSISTIEDPVEISIDGVAQTSIVERAGFGFAEALRATLRQDPDVILISEIREQRTANAVFDAGLSGHLVLSTVHGGSVLEAMRRLEHLGVSRALVSQALHLLMAQRLVKKLCSDCRVFDLRAANSIGCDVYRPVGCSRCNYSGYVGLALIIEALAIDEAVRDFFQRAEVVTEKRLAEVAGVKFWHFREQLLACLEQGEISYAQYVELNRD